MSLRRLSASSLSGRVLSVVALVLISACGGSGGGGSSGGGGGLSARALRQQPPAGGSNVSPLLPAAKQTGSSGFGPELPASVRTVRFVLESSAGSSCCVAVDPD